VKPFVRNKKLTFAYLHADGSSPLVQRELFDSLSREERADSLPAFPWRCPRGQIAPRGGRQVPQRADRLPEKRL